MLGTAKGHQPPASPRRIGRGGRGGGVCVCVCFGGGYGVVVAQSQDQRVTHRVARRPAYKTISPSYWEN